MSMETLKLTYQEYWGYYWRVVSRHKIPGIFKWDEDLVDLIEKRCQLPKGASILDLGCGGGDQAKLFSWRGYNRNTNPSVTKEEVFLVNFSART